MNSIVDRILHLHGLAAAGLIFALPLGESAVFIGFIFPGETAALLGGVLASEHRLSLAVALVAVCLGAVIGDSVGYLVGARWGLRLLEGPLSRFVKARHIERGRAEVNKRGGLAIVIGRFTTALRVLVPGLAGMAGYPYRRFLLWNVLGGVAWGVTFVLLGYAAGTAWRSVASTAGTAGLAVLAAVVVGLAVVVVVRHRRADRVAVPPER